MSNYASLLSQGAIEVREYLYSSPYAASFDVAWLESIAARMERASATQNIENQKQEIHTIAHLLVDSGPIDKNFSPSFLLALDALQRSNKKYG